MKEGKKLDMNLNEAGPGFFSGPRTGRMQKLTLSVPQPLNEHSPTSQGNIIRIIETETIKGFLFTPLFSSSDFEMQEIVILVCSLMQWCDMLGQAPGKTFQCGKRTGSL